MCACVLCECNKHEPLKSVSACTLTRCKKHKLVCMREYVSSVGVNGVCGACVSTCSLTERIAVCVSLYTCSLYVFFNDVCWCVR